jgi:hypothetical protein
MHLIRLPVSADTVRSLALRLPKSERIKDTKLAIQRQAAKANIAATRRGSVIAKLPDAAIWEKHPITVSFISPPTISVVAITTPDATMSVRIKNPNIEDALRFFIFFISFPE